MMQPRFEKRTGSSPFSLVEQPRFRAGFDFMRLRADAGEVDVVLADWWQEFSQASDAVREDLLVQVREEQNKGARRVRAVKPQEKASPAERPATSAAPRQPELDDMEPGGAEAEGEGGDAPRKRRRRRRKPGGGAGAGEASAGPSTD
jgi:poly(A) polymerase